ncbi:MAG: hypothetical protein H0U74_02260 [Bradymonadaceae bacterium]|nr:hypothetical protein [Lujinxingiaceae bacterium]
MATFKVFFCVCALIILGACRTQAPTADAPPVAEEERAEVAAPTVDDIGQVQFETSCTGAAQAQFEIGLARLHHMAYQQARESFVEAASLDVDCAMAQWGIAMTYYTPLWAVPGLPALEAGAQAVARARALGAPTEREQDFIAAVAAFYENYEEVDHGTRAEAFRAGWEQAYQRYTEDVEAASFYALATVATIPPATETTEALERAGSILERVLEQEPRHPGGHHYLIHAYDHPALAERAINVARSYAELAPSLPHPLHMPSHIFTRLGQWDEVIDLNLRSAEAAERLLVEGQTPMDFYHALDYVVYGYLQKGQDREAAQIAERTRAADNPVSHIVAVGYASIAIPARLALERRDWESAAGIAPLHPTQLPWEEWPPAQAIVHAARAVGAVNIGDLEAARDAFVRLEEVRAKTAEGPQDFWTIHVQIYHGVVDALLEQAAGNTAVAVEKMRAAATLQDALGKHPVMPGRIIEAREYLGDLLYQNGEYAQALEIFERSMELTPNRFRPLYGAASSARMAEMPERARAHYARLLELTADSEQTRPELQEAREYIKEAQAASRLESQDQ